MKTLLRGLVACVALSTAGALPAGAAELEDFAGSWVRVEHERDDAARQAEIERVTASMNFVLRAPVRAIMRRAMRPPERIEIAREGSEWTIRPEGADAWVVGRDLGDGDADEEVSSRFESGEIRQVWRHGASSHGGTVWRLGDPDGLLHVGDTVEDGNLDGTVHYSTTYRREAAAGAAALGSPAR